MNELFQFLNEWMNAINRFEKEAAITVSFSLSYRQQSIRRASNFICLSIFIPKVCVNLAFQHFFLKLSAF